MAGFDNDVIFGSNVDFTGSFPVSGQINQDGELLVGSSVAPFIRSYVPTGSNGVSLSTGPGTLDFSLSSVPNSALANSSITVSAGTGISVTGSPVSLGGTVTITNTGSSITTTQYDVLVGGAGNTIVSVGPGSAGQVLQSGGGSANPAYSTATYPSTAGTSGNFMVSDGTNWTSTSLSGLASTATITISSTEIKALRATPKTLVSAPGNGKVIVVISAICKFNYGGTNVFTNGMLISLRYTNASGNSVLSSSLITAAQIVAAASSYSTENTSSLNLINVTPISLLENQLLCMANIGASEITGNAANDNTITMKVMYYIASI